jgi:hypothetical protein
MPGIAQRRFGRGMNLTPTEARDKLAVPVLYILLGIAVPIYRGTNRGSSSTLVDIRPTVGVPEYLTSVTVPGFPVTVNGVQWDKAVYPVLIDPRWNPANKPNFLLLLKGNAPELVKIIGTELALKFHQAGYGPLPLD